MMGKPISTDARRREVAEERTSRDRLADLMPWLATMLVHFAVVLVAVIFVWVRLEKPPVEERIIPMTNCGMEPAKPLVFRDYRKPEKRQPSGGPLTPVAMPVANPAETLLTKSPLVFGLNSGPSVVQGPFTSGPAGVGSGTIFVDPPSDVGSRGRSFVFVIDASGSMVDTLPFVVAELKRAVRTLTEQHTFAVLFYQGDTVIHALKPGMILANEANKRRLFDWLDGESLTPSGLSSPIKAIEQGLLLKPQVMFLLSDNITGSGRYELHQGELLSRVKKANIGSTKISTIQFLYPDPLTKIPGMKPTLERISEQSGGIYKYLSARELGL